MEKKNMKKIKAGVAIFAVVAVTFLLVAGPAMIASDVPGSPFYDHAWVTLSATDSQSGVAYINYSVTCTNPAGSIGWTHVAGSFVQFQVTTLGYYTVNYYAADNFGNIESMKTATFWVNASDTTPPSTSIVVSQEIPTG